MSRRCDFSRPTHSSSWGNQTPVLRSTCVDASWRPDERAARLGETRHHKPQARVEIGPEGAESGTFRAVTEDHDEGLKERLSRQCEEAIGKLAEELVANPMVNAALARAFEAREK